MTDETDGSSASLTEFEAQRPRLMGLSYRIVGSLADAEDVLSEAWLRWSRVDQGEVANAEAFLTTVVTRLSMDRLRRLRARREVYPGSWLPEPVPDAPDPGTDPAAAAELADSLSMALLVVLETMSPLERAAFVLREVFQRSYAEVAAVLGRREPAVRQLVLRARARVDAGHARYRADRKVHDEVVRRFLDACRTADLDTLLDVLAPDVVIVSDGGGLARAPRNPVHGRENVARLLAAFAGNVLPGTEFRFERFNGATGIVARLDGEPISAMAVHVGGVMVSSLQLIANPEKLRSLRGRKVMVR